MVAQPWPRQAIEREGAATRLSRRGGIKLLPRLFQAMISLPALRLISGRRSRGRGRPGRSAEEGFSPCFLLRKLSPDKMADFSILGPFLARRRSFRLDKPVISSLDRYASSLLGCPSSRKDKTRDSRENDGRGISRCTRTTLCIDLY